MDYAIRLRGVLLSGVKKRENYPLPLFTLTLTLSFSRFRLFRAPSLCYSSVFLQRLARWISLSLSVRVRMLLPNPCRIQPLIHNPEAWRFTRGSLLLRVRATLSPRAYMHRVLLTLPPPPSPLSHSFTAPACPVQSDVAVECVAFYCENWQYRGCTALVTFFSLGVGWRGGSAVAKI